MPSFVPGSWGAEGVKTPKPEVSNTRLLREYNKCHLGSKEESGGRKPGTFAKRGEGDCDGPSGETSKPSEPRGRSGLTARELRQRQDAKRRQGRYREPWTGATLVRDNEGRWSLATDAEQPERVRWAAGRVFDSDIALLQALEDGEESTREPAPAEPTPAPAAPEPEPEPEPEPQKNEYKPKVAKAPDGWHQEGSDDAHDVDYLNMSPMDMAMQMFGYVTEDRFRISVEGGGSSYDEEVPDDRRDEYDEEVMRQVSEQAREQYESEKSDWESEAERFYGEVAAYVNERLSEMSRETTPEEGHEYATSDQLERAVLEEFGDWERVPRALTDDHKAALDALISQAAPGPHISVSESLTGQDIASWVGNKWEEGSNEAVRYFEGLESDAYSNWDVSYDEWYRDNYSDELSSGDGEIKITANSLNGDATLERVITNDEHGVHVHHAFFKVEGEGQGAGLGRDVMRGHFETYRKAGVDYVSTYANINVGGYMWAKTGFLPDEPSSLAEEVSSRLDEMVGNDRWVIDNNEHNWLRDPGEGRRQFDLTPEVESKLREILALGEAGDPRFVWLLADATAGGYKIGASLLLGTNWNAHFNISDQSQWDRMAAYTKMPGYEDAPASRTSVGAQGTRTFDTAGARAEYTQKMIDRYGEPSRVVYSTDVERMLRDPLTGHTPEVDWSETNNFATFLRGLDNRDDRAAAIRFWQAQRRTPTLADIRPAAKPAAKAPAKPTATKSAAKPAAKVWQPSAGVFPKVARSELLRTDADQRTPHDHALVNLHDLGYGGRKVPEGLYDKLVSTYTPGESVTARLARRAALLKKYRVRR